MKKTIIISLFIFASTATCFPQSKEQDWRYIENGYLLHKDGYVDQPYVVVLKDGTWLCVFTTGVGGEGDRGQHIVCKTSSDKGKTWSKGVRIEEPAKESSSWAMPYLTTYGRVYVFYNFNGDKIHTFPNQTEEIRDDTYGWYCYKYTDDNGKTWSQRYRLPVRTVNIDKHNNWKGKVHIQWGVGEPVNVDGGMMFGFSKIGWYIMSDSEGWFFKSTNINYERNPENLKWDMLPDGDEGLQNESFGTIHEEQNLVQMSNGTLYSMHRTESGYPLEAYSHDRGRNWTLPMPPKYYTGNKVKHPRANARVWKCKNGKYLFWHHNNGTGSWKDRNPGWLSGGIETDGKIIWSQPEIVVYDDNVKTIISYPDIIEQDGRYWITETQKSVGRVHEIPASYLEKMWSQFYISKIEPDALVLDIDYAEIRKNKTINLPETGPVKSSPGFTIDIVTSGRNVPEGEFLINNLNSETGKGISVSYGKFRSVILTMHDGEKEVVCHSDPGLLDPFAENHITIIVDNGPGIVRFVINGRACDGDIYRHYGWSFFDKELKDINSGEAELNRIGILRFYNRPLMNTEAIGNHRVISR